MAAQGAKGDAIQMVADNRRARHDYHILDTLEVGLVLTGTEVKSLRLGHVNLREGYASVEHGEVFLHNVHISPYEQGNRYNHEPLRKRKLLLHKSEIMRLVGQTREKGLTLVPLRLYFKRGRAKLELAVAKGKKQYDKRQDIAKRDADREMARAMRNRDA